MARGLIARAWLGGREVEARLGRFTLRAAQREAVARIRAAFDEFRGALVVEPPGAGKTVLALAVARDVAQDAAGTLVVAPATLRHQWHRSAGQAGVRIAFASFESLSRGRRPPPASLLIVDEAHHARTPGTMRYRVIEALAADARILLLSATPVVNRAADRTALLALFLGPRAGSITSASLARCVIRLETAVLGAPPVRRLAPLRIAAHVAGLSEGIRRLPEPFVLAAGSDALGLIRLSLAHAWSSSLAALDRALVRRLQRGEAIRDLLLAGRAPSKAALRHWCADDAATQLAFAGLVADPLVATTVPATLDRHLEAVRHLRGLIAPHVAADARARADAILRLARRHPSRRIVVFARHAATIEALARAMRGIPGVVSITGRGVRAAAGRWHREEVLASVGPGAPPLHEHDVRAVRILLATDLLAEGIELSGIGIVVHADLPWTPARVRQRRGRVARPGSDGTPVLETMIATPPDAAAIVRLAIRLRRKRRASVVAARDPGRRAELAAMLRRWGARPDRRRLARCTAPVEGFLAAVRIARAIMLFGARRHPRTARWRLFSDAARVLRLVRVARSAERSLAPHEAYPARRLLALHLARARALSLIGAEPANRGDLATRVTHRLEACMARTRPLHRASIAAIAAQFAERTQAAGGFRIAAAAAALASTHQDDGDLIAALSALLARGTPAADPGEASGAPTPRLVALLLLTPAAPRPSASPAPGPPSASPGTAAPR